MGCSVPQKIVFGSCGVSSSPLSTCHCLTYSSAPLVLNQVISSGQNSKQLVLLWWKRVVFTAPGEQTISLIWIKVEDRSAGWSACFQMRSPGVDLCPLGWPSWTWWHMSCWDWWGVWMVYSTAASILNHRLGGWLNPGTKLLDILVAG